MSKLKTLSVKVCVCVRLCVHVCVCVCMRPHKFRGKERLEWNHKISRSEPNLAPQPPLTQQGEFP